MEAQITNLPEVMATQDKPVKLERFKGWVSDLHIWRFHLQLWSVLNDRPCFSSSYQPPGYWTPIGDPRAIAALRLDEELGLGGTEHPYCEAQAGGTLCGRPVSRWGKQCDFHDPVDKTPDVQLSNTKETNND